MASVLNTSEKKCANALIISSLWVDTFILPAICQGVKLYRLFVTSLTIVVPSNYHHGICKTLAEPICLLPIIISIFPGGIDTFFYLARESFSPIFFTFSIRVYFHVPDVGIEPTMPKATVLQTASPPWGLLGLEQFIKQDMLRSAAAGLLHIPRMVKFIRARLQ